MKASQDTGSLAPLSESLSSQNILPLLYLYGKEPYLIQAGLQMVREALLDPATKDFNLEILQGKETSASEILRAARTLPMIAKARIVFVYEADKISSQELNQLLPYLENPNPSTCLCFVAETVDTRLKFFLAFKKLGFLLKLDPLSERQLPGFLQNEAARLKIRFATGAVDSLINAVGADLGQLHQALERLACFVSEGSPIQVTDVEAIVSSNRTHTIFELTDALTRQDRATAFSLLERLLQDQEPALRILVMLTRHVRQLWQIQELTSQARFNNPAEVAQAVGIPPFVAVKLLQQAKLFSKKQIHQMHENLFSAEQALKTTRIDDARYLENLVLQMCQDKS